MLYELGQSTTARNACELTVSSQVEIPHHVRMVKQKSYGGNGGRKEKTGGCR